MAVKANQTYSGKIIGGGLHHASTGSLGISVELECKEGTIQHTWYVTPNTKERVKKTLLDLGVPEKTLTSRTALENIGNVLTGKAVEFTTIEEEYKGKKHVRVQWVNPPKKKAEPTPEAAKLIADMFADETPAPQNGNGHASEETIPFE